MAENWGLVLLASGVVLVLLVVGGLGAMRWFDRWNAERDTERWAAYHRLREEDASEAAAFFRHATAQHDAQARLRRRSQEVGE